MTEVIVYGRRAFACHVLLDPMPTTAAKQRLGEWINKHEDTHIIPSPGKTAWLTPQKSAHKRLKNRATKHAANILQSTASPEHLDISWNKQILWYKDLRVVAFSLTDLMAMSFMKLPTQIPAAMMSFSSSGSHQVGKANRQRGVSSADGAAPSTARMTRQPYRHPAYHGSTPATPV